MKRSRVVALLVAVAALGLLAVVVRRLTARPAPPIPGPMVLIPGGSFLMGTNDGFFEEELPVHRVEVRSFYLDVTEVTVAAYSACVRRGRCAPAPVTADWPDIFPPERPLASSLCNGARADRQDHPVNCLNYEQAEAYCRFVGRRLPTEEEWEYAARGGDQQRRFAWGNEPPTPERMNACGTECSTVMSRVRPWTPLYRAADGWAGTAPVGSFRAGDGRWGLVDIAGNVQEWLSSPFCPYATPGCASEIRSVRGPGFLGNQVFKMRAARRNRDVTWHRSADLGVRCARTP